MAIHLEGTCVLHPHVKMLMMSTGMLHAPAFAVYTRDLTPKLS